MEPPQERVGLTREQVVRAALDLLDEVGLGGLSMRGLADRLGVRAASLYWHLRDKEQLLDLLSEAILEEVPEPEPGPWRPALDAFAEGYRQVLLAHRDAASVVAGFQAGRAALGLYERLVAVLVDAGVPAPDAADAAVLLFGQYVPAFVADETASAPAAAGARGGGYAAPLEAIERGALRVEGGASQLAVRGEPDLRDLFVAHFEGRTPQIEAAGGVVRIGGLGHGRRHAGDVALSAAVPWDVELTGGVRRLNADLEDVRLGSLTVNGGATEVRIALGRPTGTVPVTFRGGVSRAAISRPSGTAVRVRIASGASRLALDDLYFGSVGGETRWQSPDFAAAEHRFDVEIMGGATRLTVGTGGEAGAAESAEPAEAGPAAAGPAPLDGLSAAEHPHLAAVAERLAAPDMDERFRFGLTVLLDGLERRWEAAAGGR